MGCMKSFWDWEGPDNGIVYRAARLEGWGHYFWKTNGPPWGLHSTHVTDYTRGKQCPHCPFTGNTQKFFSLFHHSMFLCNHRESPILSPSLPPKSTVGPSPLTFVLVFSCILHFMVLCFRDPSSFLPPSLPLLFIFLRLLHSTPLPTAIFPCTSPFSFFYWSFPYFSQLICLPHPFGFHLTWRWHKFGWSRRGRWLRIKIK